MFVLLAFYILKSGIIVSVSHICIANFIGFSEEAYVIFVTAETGVFV